MQGDALLACAYQFVHHGSTFFHHILKMLANLSNLKKNGFFERETICEPPAPPEVDASPSAGSAALVSSSGTASAASPFSSSWHNTANNQGVGGWDWAEVLPPAATLCGFIIQSKASS